MSEGIVLLEPFIDTVVICTMTALVKLTRLERMTKLRFYECPSR